MTLASILAGETQVGLRQADLPQGVEMAEGHPQKAFMHFQQVFLSGKPEKCPELLALCMSFQASATQRESFTDRTCYNAYNTFPDTGTDIKKHKLWKLYINN